MKITPKHEVDIINAFTVDLEPVMSIAKRYGITRQGIYKVLKRAGVDTSKAANGRITVSCCACGEPVTKNRAYIRDHRYIFCDQECYYAYLEGRQQGEYNGNRHGQRIARVVVSRYYDLKPGHIVHHIDRNTQNNHPSNLMVFANNGDHVRHHRWAKDGVDVKPLWDGSQS